MEKLFSPGANALIIMLGALSIIGTAVLFPLIFFYTSIEAEMGILQKIFYVHVPLAWTSFLAFFLVCVFSIFFLRRREPFWDAAAEACAEVGVVFCTLVLVTGSVWGRAAWGRWWTWDVRLTTTLVLWLIYVAYLALRSAASEGSATQRFAAVYGVIGFLAVPLVYFSVKMMQSVHPVVIKKGESGLAPDMVRTLMFSLAVFTCFFLLLAFVRMRSGCLRLRYESLKAALHEERNETI